MSANLSFPTALLLTDAPEPPWGFINITGENPGKYVFGSNTFKPDLQLLKAKWYERKIYPERWDEVILGYVSVLLITIFTEIVISFLKSVLPYICSCVNPKQTKKTYYWREVADGVHTLLSYRFLNLWKRYRSEQKFRSGKVVMTIIALGIFFLDGYIIILTQPNQYRSDQYDYNLIGSHPIGTDIGLGKFLRRNARERPCVTPVFYNSNPTRNFSLSTCHTLNIREAHYEVNDTVDSVRIGSWFHEGGSDHLITFGNASIEVKARALIYGAEGGTWRLLFPVLHKNHTAITYYLHQLVFQNILQYGCDENSNPKSCEELFVRHRIEAKLVSKEIKLWIPGEKGIKRRRQVRGLETTLVVRIEQPWSTVFRSIGPLMTTELIEEVAGPGSYAHIATEEERNGIPGLIYLERRNVSVILLLLCFPSAVVLLSCIKIGWRKAEHSQGSGKSDLEVFSSGDMTPMTSSKNVDDKKDVTSANSPELQSVVCSQDSNSHGTRSDSSEN